MADDILANGAGADELTVGASLRADGDEPSTRQQQPTPADVEPPTGDASGADDELGTGAMQLSAALGDLHRTLRRLASRHAKHQALPDAQVEVLRLVERHPGINVREAAERLRTAANTVSTLVGELTSAGLLHRERDPANRRVVRLNLTDVARERIAVYGRVRARLLTAALHRLDDEGRRDVVAAAPHLRLLADLLADEDADD